MSCKEDHHLVYRTILEVNFTSDLKVQCLLSKSYGDVFLIVITSTHDNNCQIAEHYDFINMCLLMGYYRQFSPILL